MNSPEFTGERFVPGQGGAQITYEHMHRYLFARAWAAGRDVLDVAAGVGYGASLLSGIARRVVALDLDAASVDHARRVYAACNLDAVQGDATRLPVRSHSIDLAVAFEVLEHVEEQESLIAELSRVIRPGGVVLVSTPNKAAYSDARQYTNPYHVRELYQSGLLDLLGRHFASVQLLQQQVRAGSLILHEDRSRPGSEVFPVSSQRPPDPAGPMYYLAICAAADPAPAKGSSAYIDLEDRLFREWTGRLEAMALDIVRLDEEVRRRGLWGRELETTIEERDLAIRRAQETTAQELEARDQKLRNLQADMEREISSRDRSLQELQEEFDGRTRWARDLEGEVAARDERLKHANEALDQVTGERNRVAAHLAHIRHALLYRVLCRLGMLPR